MEKPARPQNEAARLETLRALEVLDTQSEERFDRLTRLARHLFRVPIALVSLVDDERQWFKSCDGLEVSETPREVSFCGHAILQDEILLVPDATKDERFHDNPLVADDPSIRFYAGYPLRAPNGHKLGTLCLIDREPRALGVEELAILEDLGQMAQNELVSLELATTDPLTGLSNRRGFELIAGKAVAVCRRLERPVTLLYFDLNGFKQINDTLGHREGDRILIEVSRRLSENFRDSDVVARLGGDEFCVLLSAISREDVEVPLHRLESDLAKLTEDDPSRKALSFSVGKVEFDPDQHSSLNDLLHEADQRMYEHKRRTAR